MNKPLPKYKSKGCTCDKEYINPHTCPFKEEIKNDKETLCQCCFHCRRECAADI